MCYFQPFLKVLNEIASLVLFIELKYFDFEENFKTKNIENKNLYFCEKKKVLDYFQELPNIISIPQSIPTKIDGNKIYCY